MTYPMTYPVIPEWDIFLSLNKTLVEAKVN